MWRFFCGRRMLAVALVLAYLAALPAVARAATRGARPNIVFFLVDDQRNDTLGCAGHPIIKTPVIDRLAADGVRFRNAFVTTSICAASRASIFTGLTEHTHGYTFGKPPVAAAFAETSYPALLRNAGYRTGFFGKYGVHLDVAEKSLFDSFAIQDRPYLRKGRHIDEVNTERAVKFLGECRAAQPFCLVVSFSSVHAEDSNRQPGRTGHYPTIEAAKGLYLDTLIPPPRLNDPAIFANLPEFLKTSMNRIRYHWRWDTPEKYQENMRAYFAMISGVDYMVGQVMGKLAARQLAENTVVIYAADNGYYMGDRGLAGKWSHFEESLRIPLIVYDPRLPAEKRGRVVDPIALNIDIPATILDYAGVSVPQHYQGRSVTPWVRGDKVDDWRSDFFCEHQMVHPDIPKWEGVRGQRYVYTRYFEQKPPYEFLHDLQADPDELRNFAASPDYRDVLAGMRKRCEALKTQYTQARKAASDGPQ